MAVLPTVTFAKPGSALSGTVVVFTNEEFRFGPQAGALRLQRVVERAAAAADFKGKPRSTLDMLAPPVESADRLLVVGLAKGADKAPSHDWLKLGGAVIAKLRRGHPATVLLEQPDGKPVPAEAAADFCLGAALRAYTFDKYKSNGGDDEESEQGKESPPALTVLVDDPAKAKRAWTSRLAAAGGVYLARDLVNEPANVLGPVEYAERVKELESLGVEVTIFTEKDLRKLGMGAYLGVAQGSSRPPRMVMMRWNGGKAKEKPVALIGKGVVFDTGGISIKPAAGMEDMKGDMGGSAAVVGAIATLASRKAKVNALGIVGLVENMPDANAQRPGDILTSMAGITIEVNNTDAEGRLVLCDLLHYVEKEYQPRVMIDLATLTGAIIVALGHHYAGFYATDDKLAANLSAAGEATGERVWRMPLGPEYDKQIRSRFADIKNSSGREGASITAAQFLKRFVKETPWAHIDIAGTAIASPATDVNKSWGSGYGVRLLDRLIADTYEG
ncbi:MAG: leucyl aminopeptidase [Bauldia sp.]|nr:leucyl aminopeptidase [Bauldia sp.]